MINKRCAAKKRYFLPDLKGLVCLLFLACTFSQAAPPTRDISQLATYYGFPPPSLAAQTVTLRSRYTTMIFFKGSRRMLFNGDLVWLNGACTQNAAAWSLADYDADNLIDPLLRPEVTLSKRNIALVVLDPGHGGTDSGAVGKQRGLYEKKVVLAIAQHAARKLQAAGLSVRLTRDRDQVLGLTDRTARAKRWGADLFVSIHVNATISAIASGVETYVMTAPGFESTTGGNGSANTYSGNHFDSDSSILGYYIHRNVQDKVGGADRGLRHARFVVLRDAPCPAALVECGFLSHAGDEANLLKQPHREAIAQGIADGILEYVGKCGK